MADTFHSPTVTRRVFLEKSLKGTTALTLSGFFVFNPQKGMGTDRSLHFLDLPSPQFPAWTQDGKLLVSFISQDGIYGVWNDSDKLLSIGTAIGQFNWPQGIAVNGSIAYIVDSNNGRIQRLDLNAKYFLEPFGGLGKKSGRFLRPIGICIFQDEIFIADTRNHRIQVFSMNGVVKRIFGELGDGNDQFRLPTSCAISKNGELFVVDSKHALVKVFDLEGRFIRKFAGLSSQRKEPGRLNLPTGICLDGKSGVVYVADTGNSRVQAFDDSGKFLRLIEAPALAFKTPQGLALSDFGKMAISDPDANRVWITTA
jgi:DNA-binding beta-propeller fold protein YncE